MTLLAVLAFPACAAWQDPRPGPVRAMAPRPNPPAGPARAGPERARWVTRFWEELTPAQRRLVQARLRRRDRTDRRVTPDEARDAWDVMGLPERQALVVARPAPPAIVPGEPVPGQHAEAERAAGEMIR